jgi:hypothetical protein
MRTILSILTRAGKATQLPAWLPCLIGYGLMAPCITVTTDADRELLQDLRAALRLAGLSDKEVAHYLQINKGLCSKKLNGERPLSITALALLPVDVQRWLAVRWVMRHGAPVEVHAGARLHRRAARMALHASQKAVVA